MTEVEVFIPVYNDQVYLAEAINSVLVQQEVEVSVVVMDNASTDESLGVAEEIASHDSRVIIESSSMNIGMLGNFNRCLRAANAPFFMMLCSDDLFLQVDAIRKALNAAQKDESIASVYCDLMYLDAKGRKIQERHFGRSGVFDASETFRSSIRTNRNRFGIPVLHRSEFLEGVEYPKQFPYAGDLHVSFQVAQRGRVYHIPEVLLGNRYTGENATASLLDGTRGELRELAKYHDVSLTLVDRFLSGITYLPTVIAKQAFLRYAALIREEA